ncbi:DUF3267 domain-containing protein [Larkinella sp. VNQ87]|uniref:DUF3267 domain-containing protein n=1 Tax=Larkinella sp. VNQ87 TaxID=3400921 RepID=UPI003C0403EC
MNKPTISDLQDSGRYQLIESFSIDDMKDFLLRELGINSSPKPARLTLKTLPFTLLMGGLGAATGFLLAKSAITMPFWQLAGGLVGLILLLPIHEAIHALVFKAFGAPNVGFGYSLKSLIVYAYAQRFVLSMKEVALVAAMPFLVITTALVIAWVVWPSLGLLWGSTLVFHTLACVGDYVLVRYAYKNRHRAVFTYDDLTERMSYFYERT